MFAEVFSYDRELIEKGYKIGFEIGYNESNPQSATEIAKRLLKSGMSRDEVVDYCSLSMDIVRALV